MDQSAKEYLQRRERAERAAAKRANCPQARWAHQELAQHYAAAQRQAGSSQDEARPLRPVLSIVVSTSA